MLIDWGTVIIQLVNFLILVALLKRFLYGPVIQVMEEREKTIATRLTAAATAQSEAEAQQILLTKNQEEFARDRERMERTAQEEIEHWKQQSVERIKTELAGQRLVWQQNLEDEQEAFLRTLKIHISRQVFLVAKKALADLADESLEANLLEQFLKKIHQEPGLATEEMTQNTTAILVTTGFPLHAPQQKLLQTQLAISFPAFTEVDFREEESLGFGIRLLAADQKWEWNLSRYMKDIEHEIVSQMSMTIRKGE